MSTKGENQLETECGDEVMVYDPPSGAVHVLNRTAARIRELAAGGRGVAEIAAALRGEFDVPAGCDLEADVAACLAGLQEHGLA